MDRFEFDTDTHVTAVSADEYSAAITDRWSAIGGRPNGGYILGICLQALRPAPGWLACRVTTRYVMHGYHEEDFEIWDARGTLVAQSRQLAMLP